MAVIGKLKPDQIVYSVERQRMGNTLRSRNALYTIKIISVDVGANMVFASWNGNPPRHYFERSFKRWRIKKPVAKSEILGMPSY